MILNFILSLPGWKQKTEVNGLPQCLGTQCECSTCDDFFMPLFSYSSIYWASIHWEGRGSWEPQRKECKCWYVKVWEQARALMEKGAFRRPTRCSRNLSGSGLGMLLTPPLHPHSPYTPPPGPSLSLKFLRLLSMWPSANPITHLSLWHISYKTEVVIPRVPSFCSRLISDKCKVTGRARVRPTLHNF